MANVYYATRKDGSIIEVTHIKKRRWKNVQTGEICHSRDKYIFPTRESAEQAVLAQEKARKAKERAKKAKEKRLKEKYEREEREGANFQRESLAVCHRRRSFRINVELRNRVFREAIQGGIRYSSRA